MYQMKEILILILLVGVINGGCPFKSSTNHRITEESRFLTDFVTCPTTAI